MNTGENPADKSRFWKITQSAVQAASWLLLAIGTVFYMTGRFSGLLMLVSGGIAHLFVLLMKKGANGPRNALRHWLKIITAPLTGVVLAIVIGGLIMLVTGYDAIEVYQTLFYGGFIKHWHISVLNAAPLMFTGLSVAFALKAGLFNIGAEGQYYIGAMAATWLGISLNLPGIVSLVLIAAISAAFAAAWNILPAFLKVRTGAHEVITTMMLAHIARYLSPIFIRRFGGDPADSSHPYVSDTILTNNFLPRFKAMPIFENANYRLHIGILFAIATALFINYLLYRTRTGFEIRAVGQNKDAARAQGISIGKNILVALLIAGALAGLAGVNQVTGLDHRLYDNLQANYGWNGISVALLAGGHPVGVIFTSLLWGILDAGGQYMARTTKTPNAIVEIVKGIMLFLVVARYIYFYIGRFWKNLKERRSLQGGENGIL